MARKQSMADASADRPLFVDLDGTLITTDILWESCFAMLKRFPWLVFMLPVWLVRGRANLKKQIADRVDIQPELLPYNQQLLTALKQDAREGRRLYLATSATQKYADEIAAYLQLFDGVLASAADVNLSGERKLRAIREIASDFDYAGNAGVDLAIWRHATGAVLVNPNPGVAARARRLGNVVATFDDARATLKDYVKAIRVHQWSKNLLLVVPLITSHSWHDMGEHFVPMLMAIGAFSLCSSGVYLMNDLLDLESDRQHPVKKNRALAAARIPIVRALLLSIALVLAGFVLATAIRLNFIIVLAGYFALTAAYSLGLKQIALVDVIVLAMLYTLRIIAGGEVLGVGISFYLMAFSAFMFYNLALAKRCAELYSIGYQGGERLSGRDYRLGDREYLRSMGIASGYLSILVLAMYINSPEVGYIYARVQLLWLLCPLFFYWISRVWIMLGRGEMHHDPVVFALKDRASLLVGLACMVIILLAAR